MEASKESNLSEEHIKLIDEINTLKKEKNAVILVHNYQRPEIYEVADFIGDSLGLSKQASETKAERVVFAGVRFMAETAKILSPEKKVLLPAKNAGCPLADSITPEQLIALKEKHPNAPVMTYVNSSAEVKALSDYSCTSMNAVKIAEAIESDEIIFIPDINMAKWIEEKTGKKIIHTAGHCFVHSNITAQDMKLAKKTHPDALIISHPECSADVLAISDEVTGTGGMIKFAKENPAKEFIIGTEEGMCNRLRRECPDKKFYCFSKVCFNMKYTTLENIKEALLHDQHEIILSPEIIENAKISVDRMMEYAK